ncbi:DEAD/DEAH box helicase [Lentibacillus amyloliquefaciens]|uniref:DEAD/DEAH box helicase n=1 Tax=Lentibacillus amyloliquefaciens TaxID=1472767 RepID=A0A0U4DRY5_9BACI|nr:DEAD/DEAH box helicase [Lentibacillus amyloliquefaciens]ALX48104.1 DEAD/DEAH box helicase [Lentibacillus amyloliquefaciens]
MSHQFNQFSFQPEIKTVIEQLNFQTPTPIQQKVIPSILKGTSVIGQSHTGSGKTHAYLLPLFNQLDTNKREVKLVITAPTRELARQIYDEVRKVIDYAGMQGTWIAKLLVGGTDKQKMMDKLKKPPHIIVGTPGRILDMVKEDAISIYSASSFVIDEADLMLDLGFIREVDQLLLRADENIQILAFSATIPQQLEQFYSKYLKNPLHVKINDQLAPEQLEHVIVPIRHREASDIIIDISKTIHPYISIIFANGKDAADSLADSLLQKGLNVGIIHGGISPRERKRTLKDIQNLKFQYIVATDLASRGIDIKGVSHVINAQFPKEEDFYVHRAGRTARAGMEGTVISLYDEADYRLLEKLKQKGLTFAFRDLKNGEWKEAKAWNERTKRRKTDSSTNSEAWKKVKKPKKVKPGYKKKMKNEQEKIKKQMTSKSKKHRK